MRDHNVRLPVLCVIAANYFLFVVDAPAKDVNLCPVFIAVWLLFGEISHSFCLSDTLEHTRDHKGWFLLAWAVKMEPVAIF